MVYNKRLGLFDLSEAENQESDTAELNDGNALLQHVRKYVPSTRKQTYLYLHTHTHFMNSPLNEVGREGANM